MFLYNGMAARAYHRGRVFKKSSFILRLSQKLIFISEIAMCNPCLIAFMVVFDCLDMLCYARYVGYVLS